MLERKGLDVTRTTLWDQIDALAGWIEPTWRALRELTLGVDWVHCDETRWPMLDGPGSCKWWTWCVASSDAVFYDINRHRPAKAAQGLLDGFEGILITEGYAAYESLARAGPGIRLAHCWANVRRRFLEAEAFCPDLAETPVRLIGQLLKIEAELPRLPRGASLAEGQMVLEACRTTREERSSRVVNELRGVVVGRKNHYGSNSKGGSMVAARPSSSACSSPRGWPA